MSRVRDCNVLVGNASKYIRCSKSHKISCFIRNVFVHFTQLVFININTQTLGFINFLIKFVWLPFFLATCAFVSAKNKLPSQTTNKC